MPIFKINEDYSIKIADHDDDITHLFVKAQSESMYVDVPVDINHFINQAREYVDGGVDKGIILLLLYRDLPVGFLVGKLTKGHAIINELCACEVAWYVEQEHRQRHSLLLFEAYEDWAKRAGAEYILCGSGYDDRLKNFYTRKNYRKVEQAYYRKVN